MSGISSPWNDYDVFNACRRSDNPAYVAASGGCSRGSPERWWAARCDAHRRLAGVAEECITVGGELRVVLEQEPVCRVRVDLHPSLRDQAREQVRIVRKDHRIAVAAG